MRVWPPGGVVAAIRLDIEVFPDGRSTEAEKQALDPIVTRHHQPTLRQTSCDSRHKTTLRYAGRYAISSFHWFGKAMISLDLIADRPLGGSRGSLSSAVQSPTVR
jgi:cytochrome c peroxidase